MKPPLPLLTLVAVLTGTARAADPPKFISPEVTPDGRITVRIYKPQAQAIQLVGGWDNWEKKTMLKDEQGLWSLTTDPQKPNIYEYYLQVDGVATVDPKNVNTKDTAHNLLEVPGPETAFEDIAPGPKGSVHEQWYDSKATGSTRRVHVYTPPGYETSNRRYPVLYLLHGSGDDDSGWTSFFGRANVILDNLIASKQTVPMIVVMPLGHVSVPRKELSRVESYGVFENDLIGDVLPLVEKTYRVAPGRMNRALAGLSMGGGQTVVVGLKHPELFCAYGVFSGGVWEDTPEPFTQAIATFAKSRLPNDALWIGVGKNDFVYKRAQVLLSQLKDAKVRFTYYEDDSTHSWPTWRDFLHRFTPFLFLPKR